MNEWRHVYENLKLLLSDIRFWTERKNVITQHPLKKRFPILSELSTNSKKPKDMLRFASNPEDEKARDDETEMRLGAKTGNKIWPSWKISGKSGCAKTDKDLWQKLIQNVIGTYQPEHRQDPQSQFLFHQRVEEET